MVDLRTFEVWFVTGSQHLYGNEVLVQVAEHVQQIARAFNDSPHIPVQVVFKPVVTTPEAIYDICLEANCAKNCIGLITWMHTFSPAKMWLNGLVALQKPFLHLHTQFNRDIPWATIDMNFMNLNQSAHGDREFGFAASRMRLNRKVVVGHWQTDEVQQEIGVWTRAASARLDWQCAKFARFGDNMRQVAVTEGDKVAAQIQFGYAVNGYGVHDLVESVNQVAESEVDHLVDEYETQYHVAELLRARGKYRESLRDAARIELGLRHFLDAGQFKGFTDTFEDLPGLKQLPGIAVQRLMADGYGFGAEGDWKTAALLRAVYVIGAGLPGGASFMEDYTYHMDPMGEKVLGAHMLEVAATIADGKPSAELYPLSIGGKADPVRLIFNTRTGPALNASMIDMGNRFRLIVNEVEVVQPDAALPQLPVARAVWLPKPNFKTALAAWIYAGGAHHTAFSQAITSAHLRDFAEMCNIEFLLIGENTDLVQFKNELRWNDLVYSRLVA
ncbi:MAG: L-arabinose isomerase [Chloroflexi bacterium]|nr:L-arabinose isomerase [Chloroflexota bacterium]